MTKKLDYESRRFHTRVFQARQVDAGTSFMSTPKPNGNVMTVDTIMTRRIITVTMDDSLRTVRELFRQYKFHHLLVVDKDRLVGILSDRDFLKSVSPYLGKISETERDSATLNKRVHQVMTHQLVTVAPHTRCEEAARVLIEKGVSCLPVVSSDGRLQGVLTWKDLLKSLFTEYLTPGQEPRSIGC